MLNVFRIQSLAMEMMRMTRRRKIRRKTRRMEERKRRKRRKKMVTRNEEKYVKFEIDEIKHFRCLCTYKCSFMC